MVLAIENRGQNGVGCESTHQRPSMIAWGVYFEKTPTFSEASSVTAADTVSVSDARNALWDVIHACSLTRRTANCKNRHRQHLGVS
jgi:hypothetical protein